MHQEDDHLCNCLPPDSSLSFSSHVQKLNIHVSS
uniref:Uncharacterized protein n=1 Tax=Rhizophora mucronata TaxID=61149 RepID=A0A2P2NA63_RHIMU